MKHTGNVKIILLVAVTALMAAAVVLVGFIKGRDSKEKLPGDGYVLQVQAEGAAPTVTQARFAGGTAITAKLHDTAEFRDISGARVTVGNDSFLHYADESMAALSDGMVVNMQEASTGMVDFYRLPASVVAVSDGTDYIISHNNTEMTFGELLWQLSGTKFLCSSPKLTLVLAGGAPIDTEGYVEVTYPASDVVQLANAGHVWQTVTSNSKIIYASGAVLDLAEGTVTNPAGDLLFSREDLAADMGMATALGSTQTTIDWVPPVFNIETEDGLDGEGGQAGEAGDAGTNGIEGIAGQQGTDGESGEAGEQGDDGESGDSGTDGTEGGQGAQGAQGAQGTTGGRGAAGAGGAAGGVGATGADGANGKRGSASSGTQGSSGSSGGLGAGTDTDNEVGTIRVSDLHYDCSSADLKIETTNPTAFIPNTGTVEIIDVDSNNCVWTCNELDFSSQSQWLADSTNAILSTKSSGVPQSDTVLSPNREYSINISSGYQTVSGGITYTGSKTFYTRNFFTAAEGFTVNVDHATSDKLYLTTPDVQDGLGTTYYRAVVHIAGYDIDSDVMTVTASSGPQTVDMAQLLSNSGVTGVDSEDFANKPYTIDIYSADDQGKLAKDANTGEYLQASRSSQVISGTTLKRTPSFDKVTRTVTGAGGATSTATINSLTAALSAGGQYTFTVADFTDPDAAVTNYHFKVTDVTNNKRIPLFETDSATPKVDWYFGSLSAGTYDVDVDVTYNDNDKNNIVSLSKATIVTTGAGEATVGFKPEDITDTAGVTTPGIGHDIIRGRIVITHNGADINTSEPFEITVTDNNGQYYDSFNLYLEPTQIGNTEWELPPLRLVGLKQGQLYLFTVKGTVNLGNGTFARQRIGSVTVKTTSATGSNNIGIGGMNDDADNTFYAFEVVPSSGGGVVAIATPYSNDPNTSVSAVFDKINTQTQPAPNPSAPSYLEDIDFSHIRKAARAVEFTVYTATDASGTIAGEERCRIVKDLYECFYPGSGGTFAATLKSTYTDTEFKEDSVTPGIISGSESDFLLHGPLSDDRYAALKNSAFQITLTEDDFLYASPSLNISKERSKLIIRATGLYDYTYNLDSYDEYARRFNYGKPDYNYLPLKSFVAAQGAASWVNQCTLDLNAVAPTLPADPEHDVEVTPLTNSAGSNIFLSPDKRLDESSVTGFKVQAKYDNVNNDTESITYYAMTMDALHDFLDTHPGQPTTDIIAEYEKDIKAGNTNNTILFSCELDLRNFTAVSGVPPLYVVQTAEQSLLNKKLSNENGKAVYYTNRVPRGDCYVFAYTLKSRYGVSAGSDAWLYPNNINVPGQNYKYRILRSPGTEVLLQAPKIATYLINADSTQEKWQVYIYDPDRALYTDASGNMQAYAGDIGQACNQVRFDMSSSGTSGSLLNAAISTVSKPSYTGTATATDYKQIATQCFKLPAGLAWQDGDLVDMQVTVTNGTVNLPNTYYTACLRVAPFKGRYTESLADGRTDVLFTSVDLHYDKFKGCCLLQGGSHQNDCITEAAMAALPVSISLPGETEVLQLAIDKNRFVTEPLHLVGLHYVLKDNTGKTVQGTAMYDKTGTVPLSIGDFKAGATVTLSLSAVYDTGIAGTKLDSVQKTLNAKISDPLGSGSQVNNYVAIQYLNDSYYTSSGGTQELIKSSSKGAAGSLYAVTDDAVPTGYFYAATYRLKGAGTDYKHQYTYTDKGAAATRIGFNTKQLIVFKGLKETPLMLVDGDPSDNRVTVDSTGKAATIKVPRSIPSAISVASGNAGLNSCDIMMKLTPKTLDMLSDGTYSNKIFLELYTKDASGLTKVSNTDNKLFRHVSDNEGGSVSYVTTRGDVTSGDASKASDCYYETVQGQELYAIGVRNLEPGKQYYIKAYCIEQASNNKVYVLDIDPTHTDAQRGDDGVMQYGLSTLRAVRVGDCSGKPSALPLSVNYTDADYDRQQLTLEYGLYRPDYRTDLYVEYELKNASGTQTYDNQTLMNMLNYSQTKQSSYEYYDGTAWKTYNYTQYETASNIPYTLDNSDVSHTLTFNSATGMLSPGEWKLTVRIRSKRGGGEVDYYTNNTCKDTDLTAPGAAPDSCHTVTFTVPYRTPPVYTVRMVPRSNTSDPVKVTVKADDKQHWLGCINSGTRVPGQYMVKAYKNNTELTLASAGPFNVSATNEISLGNFDNSDSQYRIQILGVEYADAAQSSNSVLYDTNDYTAVRNNLHLNSNLVDLGTVSGEYDSERQTFAITSAGGTQLSRIDSETYMLARVEGTAYETETGIGVERFKAVSGKSGRETITLSIKSLIDGLEANNNTIANGEYLTLSVSFNSGPAPVASAEFVIKYTQPSGQ